MLKHLLGILRGYKWLTDNHVGVTSQRFLSLKHNLNDVIFKVLPCLFENNIAVIKEL